MPPRRALARALSLVAPVLLSLALMLGLTPSAHALSPGRMPAYSQADGRSGGLFTSRLMAADGGIDGRWAGPTEAARVGMTVQMILGATAVDRRLPEVARGMGFLHGRLETYLRPTGTVDNPGRLAYVILAMRSAGADPRRHATSGDLVARLRATQQRTGPDAGLYGTAAAFSGSFSQGLVLAALRTSGVLDPAGVRWLLRQQCADGGFTFYRADAQAPCSSDSNNTSYAAQGLIAQGTPPVRALFYLSRIQNADGGFPYRSGGASDGTSTANGLQAIMAFRADPTGPLFRKNGVDAVRALSAFKIHEDDPSTPYDDRGAWSYSRVNGKAGAADMRFTTPQAMPAAMGRAFPY